MHDEMIDALPELALDLTSVVEAQGERCQVRNAYRSQWCDQGFRAGC